MLNVNEELENVLQTNNKEEIVVFMNNYREELTKAQFKKLMNRYHELEAQKNASAERTAE